MSEEGEKDTVASEITRGNYVRAAFLERSLELSKEEQRELEAKALWQMGAVYRNHLGTKRLAQEYGISTKELRRILEEYAEEERRQGNYKDLEPCYDSVTGKYISFDEWMDELFKRWSSLPV